MIGTPAEAFITSQGALQSDINSFHANVLFIYPLKTSENERFSSVFKGYR